MATIPDKFVDLATAYRSPQQSMCNVIGIVVDLMAPTVTKKGDYMVTFKLMDLSMRDGLIDSNGSQVNGLKVRFFRPQQKNLPQVKQQGDIMILKNIKMSVWDQQPVGISNYQTSAVVYPIIKIHDSNTSMLYKPMDALGHPDDVFRVEDQEKNYVIQLKHDMRSAFYDLPPPSASAPAVKKYRYPGDEDLTTVDTGPVQPRPVFGSKFKLVKDLRHRNFADICGQVVKQFSGARGTELYITDYTENKEMFFYAPPEMLSDEDRDGDDYGYTVGSKKKWPGPFGHLVLKVNTKDPHVRI
jgi:protection of telomeres protein 1